MVKMLVVADDFTGANDTGVQLAKKGARTEVWLHDKAGGRSHADVMVISTESRAADALTAARSVTQAIHQLADTSPPPLVYKKIDSTFRGNVGAEIAAAMQATDARLAVVAAAIPAAGRTTLNGHCLVNQIPVHQTEFASDPKTPVTTSRIASLLARQTSVPVREIGLAEIHSPAFLHNLRQYGQEQRLIVVCDAVSEGDLNAIALAVSQLDCRYLLVGAAGLANALPSSLYLSARGRLPLLIVAGSMSEVTQQQIVCAAKEEDLRIVDIDVSALVDGDAARQIDQLAEKAAAILQQQHHCVLRTCRDETDRQKVAALCRHLNLTRSQLGETICRHLGELTLTILDRARIGGLFLTGGDVAIAIARGVNAQGYRIVGEIAPCIPWGNFTQSDLEDLPVITKAGGFGNENTLREAIWFTEEMYSGEE